MARSAHASTEPTNLELIELIAAFMTAYYRDFADAAAHEGLTSVQAKAISALQQSPSPMRALAERLYCDASNVTGIVDRLESRDLVRREASATDRRVKNVVATQEGSQAMQRIRAGMRGTQQALDSLSDEERRTLYDLLARLRPTLEHRD